jgi:hypothetical protein
VLVVAAIVGLIVVTGGDDDDATPADTTTADTIVFNAGSVSAVPEPSSAIAMGLLGIVGFAGNRRRRRQESVA